MSPYENTPSHKGSGNGRYYGESPISQNEAERFSSFQEEDEIDIKKLIHIAFRYKWVILFFLVIGAAGGYYHAASQIPIFQGEGSMIIAEDRARYSMAGSDLSSLLTTSFGIGQSTRVKNELEVMRSRRFIGEIADQLLASPYDDEGTLWPILWMEFPVDSTLASRGEIIERIRGRISVDLKDQETDVVRVTFQSPLPREAKVIVNAVLDEYYEFSTRQNRLQARSAIDFLQNEEKQLRNKLIVSEENLREFMERERLVQMDDQSRRLVNTMADLEAQRKSSKVNQVAIRSAIEHFKNELEELRPGLADQFAASRFQRLNRYQFQLAELETEKMLMKSRNPFLRENPESEPSYLKLRREAEELRKEIRSITSDLVEQGDRFIGFLDDQSGGITGRLKQIQEELAKLQMEEQQLAAQMEVLDSRLKNKEAFFEKLPDNMVELVRLQRAVKVNERLYLTVATQTSELAVWEQTQMGFGRVLDYSIEPRQPISPRTRNLLMMGFLLGGIVGAGFVVIREITQTRVNSIEKLKNRNIPLLAVIPDLDRTFKEQKYKMNEMVTVGDRQVSTDLVALLDSISPGSESYRRLQSNLLYSQPDKPHHVISITSTKKSEGKTTVLSNLGITLAEAGNKVVLVDCDFRRPRMHRCFGVDRKPGIVEYLFNEASLDEAIQSTTAEGLDVVAVGKQIPNPYSLSRSEKLIDFINELKNRYDYVLLDTAPYGIITDAAPLFGISDGVLLAVRFNQTQEADLDQTLENLRQIKCNLIGSVMVGFNHKKATGYYYTSWYYRSALSNYNQYVDDSESS